MACTTGHTSSIDRPGTALPLELVEVTSSALRPVKPPPPTRTRWRLRYGSSGAISRGLIAAATFLPVPEFSVEFVLSTRLTRTSIRALLDRHGIDPSRALGQNFLCDPGTIDKIVRLAGVRAGDHVVEIGPGLGSLTLALAEADATVVAVELDRYLVPVLRDVVEGVGATPVTIIEHDALTLDWDDALGAIAGPDTSWSVVANLPYNIATPLVLDLLAAEPRFDRWLVMVQKEVGDRLAAGPGSKIYGIPSVLTAYWGVARIVATVPPQVFLPQPNVDSALVRIDRHVEPPLDVPFADVERLVRAGFGQRRKMLRRSLSAFLDEQQIAAAGVAPTDRAEQLDLQQWGRLAEVHRSSV